MTLYNIHTHRRQDGEMSILNVFPQNFDERLEGYISCGVHPWYVDECEDALSLLEEIVKCPNVVAIGEAGYDALRGAEKEIQINCFERQIELSELYEKPMIIHCVKAWDWLITSHKKYKPKQTWILHGFRGKLEQMQQLLRVGMKFSIGMNFNKDAVLQIPIDSLFLETDDSGVKIEDVYKLVAEIRDVELECLGHDIEWNVRSTFKVS